MSNTNRKQVRNGRSLTLSHDNITQRQLIEFGLSELAARRAVYVRRVLPYVEDPTIPCIDARGLWSRIGKPHKRFTDWANYYLKDLIDNPKLNAEISVFEDASKSGKPTKDYTLSRDLAAKLAMQANTEDGDNIRRYFLDMESIVFRLAEYNLSRAVVPVKLDNRLTHATYKRSPMKAIDHEQQLKSRVCKVLTGLFAGEVRLKYRMGIRDTLKSHPAHLDTYNEAYTMAVSMYESGMKWKVMEPVLVQVFGGKIDLEQLLGTQ
jgi:anti-repressor protein